MQRENFQHQFKTCKHNILTKNLDNTASPTNNLFLFFLFFENLPKQNTTQKKRQKEKN
jgi:hypothetical protein